MLLAQRHQLSNRMTQVLILEDVLPEEAGHARAAQDVRVAQAEMAVGKRPMAWGAACSAASTGSKWERRCSQITEAHYQEVHHLQDIPVLLYHVVTMTITCNCPPWYAC